MIPPFFWNNPPILPTPPFLCENFEAPFLWENSGASLFGKISENELLHFIKGGLQLCGHSIFLRHHCREITCLEASCTVFMINIFVNKILRKTDLQNTTSKPRLVKNIIKQSSWNNRHWNKQYFINDYVYYVIFIWKILDFLLNVIYIID